MVLVNEKPSFTLAPSFAHLKPEAAGLGGRGPGVAMETRGLEMDARLERRQRCLCWTRLFLLASASELCRPALREPRRLPGPPGLPQDSHRPP